MDPLLDIVDENDNFLKKELMSKIRVSKLSNNNYLRYVNVLAFNKKGLLLLPKRSANSIYFPNCYDFSSGKHVLSDENYDAAVKRSIKEELGLTPSNIEFLGKLSPLDGVSGFMKIYKIIIDESNLNYNKKDFQSLEWYDINIIIEMIENNPSNFKSDLLIVLKWYNK